MVCSLADLFLWSESREIRYKQTLAHKETEMVSSKLEKFSASLWPLRRCTACPKRCEWTREEGREFSVIINSWSVLVAVPSGQPHPLALSWWSSLK